MKGNVRIRLNRTEIANLMKSGEVVSCLQSEAGAIAQEAGHAEVSTFVGVNRANVSVMQNMTHDDMENNTLLKAVHAR